MKVLHRTEICLPNGQSKPKSYFEGNSMKKLISRQTHGVLDYGYAALITAAPELVGYKDEKTAAGLSRVVGSAVTATSLLTRYELGAVRVLPFKAHLAADIAAGLFTATAPWLFGFSHNTRARNVFLGMGLFSVMAGLITDSDEMPK
jgi:hypothetical protein